MLKLGRNQLIEKKSRYFCQLWKPIPAQLFNLNNYFQYRAVIEVLKNNLISIFANWNPIFLAKNGVETRPKSARLIKYDAETRRSMSLLSCVINWIPGSTSKTFFLSFYTNIFSYFSQKNWLTFSFRFRAEFPFQHISVSETWWIRDREKDRKKSTTKKWEWNKRAFFTLIRPQMEATAAWAQILLHLRFLAFLKPSNNETPNQSIPNSRLTNPINDMQKSQSNPSHHHHKSIFFFYYYHFFFLGVLLLF